MENHGEEIPLPGLNLTHRQIFFLGFSQVTKMQAVDCVRMGYHSYLVAVMQQNFLQYRFMQNRQCDSIKRGAWKADLIGQQLSVRQ